MVVVNTNKEFTKLIIKKSLKGYILAAACLYVFGFTLIFSNSGDYNKFVFAGALEIIIATIFLVCGIIYIKSGKKKIMEKLQNYTFCVEATTYAAMENFSSAMMVAGVDGEIMWYNTAFSRMIGRENLFGEYFQDIFPELQFGRFSSDVESEPEEYERQERAYMVSGRMVPVQKEEQNISLVSVCFTDVSDKKQILKRLTDKKTVVCSAVIDNYDEVFKSTPNTNHGALIGDIESRVNKWVEKGDGISIRYERDKFLMIFEAAKFFPLIQEKFSILDDVKEIEQGNRLPVTFSIGVCQTKESIRENEQMARTALDMALGRGGDQVVIKNAVGFQFYGAKSVEVEKSTRVKSRVVAHSLRDLADRASSVIIMGHKNADTDSLGAAVGLFRMFRDRRIDTYIALDRAQNNVKIFLGSLLEKDEYKERIIGEDKALDLLDAKTLLIVVDTHKPSMLEYPSVLKNAYNVALIDHHRRSEEFIENAIISYHEPYASSSCEMVTEILQYMDSEHNLKRREAELLYSGIYMDTKGFTFKTGARTFEAASYLRRHGADPVNVRRLLRNDLDSYIQKTRIVSDAEIYRSNIAIALCHEKLTNTQLVVAQAADEMLNISGIEAAFVLALEGNKAVISGRSLGAVNVQVILEKLGGGGHITIAGAQIKNNNLELAKMELQEAIDEVVFDGK